VPGITDRLFEAQSAGVDHQTVEMPFVHCRQRHVALPCSHGARPDALEMTDAERAGLGYWRERGLDEAHGELNLWI
jgi:hypothetical protein